METGPEKIPIPRWLPPVLPDLYSPRRAHFPGPLLPNRPSLLPKFYLQPVFYFQITIPLVAFQTWSRKKIINCQVKETHITPDFWCSTYKHCTDIYLYSCSEKSRGCEMFSRNDSSVVARVLLIEPAVQYHNEQSTGTRKPDLLFDCVAHDRFTDF